MIKLDIINESCPMTFVKVRLKLEELKKKQVLEILLKVQDLEHILSSLQEIGARVIDNLSLSPSIRSLKVQKIK